MRHYRLDDERRRPPAVDEPHARDAISKSQRALMRRLLLAMIRRQKDAGRLRATNEPSAADSDGRQHCYHAARLIQFLRHRCGERTTGHAFEGLLRRRR